MTVDWSNTVIYLLRSNDPLIEDGYIGHSGDFHKRKIQHKSNCNNVKSDEYNKKAYVFIREIGGYDNWDFEILETANLEDEKEAEALERYWIEKLEPTLNEYKPSQTPEERAEYLRVYSRLKYREMKDDPEYRRKIYERNRKQKAANPEKVAASRAREKEKITCVCGVIHNRGGKSNHLKTPNHKEFLKNNPQET